MKQGVGKRRKKVGHPFAALIYRWAADRSDQFWLAILALVVVISRWINHGQFLYLADSVKYALALDNYDVSIHQPHPPGYALYVLLAKPIYLLTHDANLSLIVVGIILSIGALYAVYYLAKAVYGRPTAWVATLLFISAPVVWFHGQVALSYISDALFSAWFGYLAYRVLADRSRNPRLVMWASLVLALGAGFRPTLAVFMFPLWCWMIWRQRSWRAALINAAIIVLITLGWVWPAAILSGGWEEFWQSVNALVFAPNSLSGAVAITHGLSRVWDHFNMMLKSLLINFNFAAVIIVLFLALLATPRMNDGKANLFNLYFWLAMILPASLFYLAGVYTLPGYLLVIIPALTVIVAKATTTLIDAIVPLLFRTRSTRSVFSTALLMGITALLIVGNIYIYFRPGQGAIESNEPTHYTIRSMNRFWSAFIPTLKSEFNPQNTVVVVDQPFIAWGLEHFQYYLPGYAAYQRIGWGFYNPDQKTWFSAYDRKLTLKDELRILPSDTKLVLVMINWHGVVTNGLQIVPLPNDIGAIAYYDLTDPTIRDSIGQVDHVKFLTPADGK